MATITATRPLTGVRESRHGVADNRAWYLELRYY